MDIWTFLVIGFVIPQDSDAKSEDDCSVNVKFRRCYSRMFTCVSCFYLSLGSVLYKEEPCLHQYWNLVVRGMNSRRADRKVAQGSSASLLC